MIKPGEIQLIARKVSVRDSQIEKDYILSWVLKGIAEHSQLAEIFVFKGGTVLKKAWFPDYRFSEDLDFTLLNENITNDEIFKWCEATNKGPNPKEFPIKLEAKLNVYRNQWKGSLNDQINDLPDFDRVIREVRKQVRKLKLN